jgi:hypothetical protein
MSVALRGSCAEGLADADQVAVALTKRCSVGLNRAGRGGMVDWPRWHS